MIVDVQDAARAARNLQSRVSFMSEFSERLLHELIDGVRQLLRKEANDRVRDVYLIGDIEKDSARLVIERLRELTSESSRPITLYMNSAGGNVTDGLAIHDTIRHLVAHGIEVSIVVQGMAYSMGSVVLQAASPGRRLAFPHSWIMIHEPAKWAGWQSTSAAAQHLDRLKQMQAQIYRILALRSGRPLSRIIRDTKRTDFYLDAMKAKEYGLIDEVLEHDGLKAEATTETLGTVGESEPQPQEAAARQGDPEAATRPGEPEAAARERDPSS
jgi:ATP-dependent Clp protease, protease subunit